MNSEALLNAMATARSGPDEDARMLVVATQGYSQDDLYNLFTVALGSGDLSKADAENILKSLQDIGIKDQPEQTPPLTALRESVELLEAERRELQFRQDKVSLLHHKIQEAETQKRGLETALADLQEEYDGLQGNIRRIEQLMKKGEE